MDMRWTTAVKEKIKGVKDNFGKRKRQGDCHQYSMNQIYWSVLKNSMNRIYWSILKIIEKTDGIQAKN